MSYLALDVGEKKIGVAVSDELAMFAHPRPAIICGGKQEFKEISGLVRDIRPQGIIIGDPIELSGQRGPRALWVEKFCEKLKGHLSGDPVLRKTELILWDERMSSVQAERSLRDSGIRGEARKAMTDSVAAVIILESFLENLKRR